MLIFNCECGYAVNGNTDQEVLHRAYGHMQEFHNEAFSHEPKEETQKLIAENITEARYYM